MKIAFIFPGQGAQYIGMGKEFYDQIPASREVFDLASQVTGLDLPALCFEENEQIHITEYTQIAMVATEAALWKALTDRGVHSCVNGGLSLGEYGALIASEAMSMEDAFRIVRKRGIFMQEAVPTGGAMAAVIGLDSQRILDICQETEGIVSIANYNCPGQIVITGEAEAVKQAGEALKEAGARRVLPLKVSGPFHSSMLEEAGRKLDLELEKAGIQQPRVPYVANVTADYVTEKEPIRELLAKQVSSSVKWQQSVERMIAQGVDTFVEIGPGRTLTGFLKKIDKNVKGYNLDKLADLDQVAEALSGR